VGIAVDGKDLIVDGSFQGAEIAICGPGYGESALVCLAPNSWLIVDCCVHHDYEEPTPLAYLRLKGLDPEKVVKMIVISHWHDDHIRGAATLIDRCPNATVVFSSMIRHAEFTHLVAAYYSKYNIDSSGVTEMAKVFDALQSRKKSSATPVLAVASRRLLKLDAPWPVEIWSLSPSDRGIQKALQALSSMMKVGQPKLRLPVIAPNTTSIVLWIKIGLRILLFGGDLEQETNESLGWSAILADTSRPEGNAWAFKLPHHGGKSGYNAEVWTTMLQPQPIALIVPFRHGNRTMPSREDADRILKHTNQAFLTADPAGLCHKQNRCQAVERTIRETGKPLLTSPFAKGIVSVKFNPKDASDPIIDLLHGAIPLRNMQI